VTPTLTPLLQTHKGSSETRLNACSGGTMMSFKPTKVRLKHFDLLAVKRTGRQLQTHKGSSETMELAGRLRQGGTELQTHKGSPGTARGARQSRSRCRFKPTKVRLELMTHATDARIDGCFKPTKVRLEPGPWSLLIVALLASNPQRFAWNRLNERTEISVLGASNPQRFAWNASGSRRVHRFG